MQSFKFFSGILALALLSLVLLACTDTPIFYTLEKAYSIDDDRGLDNTAIVEKIVYTGAEYFVHAQTVYQRDPGASTNWQRVPPPVSGALCGGLEYFDGDIIAWFYSSTDLEPVGLYSRDPAVDSPTDPWTGPITDSDWPTAGDWPDLQLRIHFIKAAGTQLFISTAVYHADDADPDYEKTFYNLFYAGAPISGIDDFDACFPVDLDNEILDVEWDGTDYWSITTPGVSGVDQPTYLYQNTVAGDPSAFTDVSAAGPAFWKNGTDDPSGTLYMPHSLYYASGVGRLYLSGWHGRIFINSLATWSDWATVSDAPDRKTVEVGNDDRTVQFSGFVETGRPIGPSPSNQLFVGSSQFGYFYFSDLLDETDTLSPGDLVTASTPYEYFPAGLQNGAIRSFLVDTEDPLNIMFACTAGSGLWRGEWNTVDSLWIWKQE